MGVWGVKNDPETKTSFMHFPYSVNKLIAVPLEFIVKIRLPNPPNHSRVRRKMSYIYFIYTSYRLWFASIALYILSITRYIAST